MILRTTVSASKNPEYNTSPGNTTVDKIFLLSIDEAQKYLPSDEERKCTPTNYASSQGGATTIRSTSNGNSTCWWWLRSPGIEQNNVAGIIMMEKSIMVVMRQIMGMGIFGQLCESVLLIDTWLEFRAIQSEFVDHQSL